MHLAVQALDRYLQHVAAKRCKHRTTWSSRLTQVITLKKQVHRMRHPFDGTPLKELENIQTPADA